MSQINQHVLKLLLISMCISAYISLNRLSGPRITCALEVFCQKVPAVVVFVPVL